VGGETAEMPSFYSPGEYDLAGFAVGSVDSKDVLPSRKIKSGDVLIGLASSGFHSNGFSLVRRLLTESDASSAFKTECLAPTRIYAGVLAPLISKRMIKGLAHITGSGFLNVPRMSTQVDYEIELPSIGALPAKSARLWRWLEQVSKLTFAEQAETFNCGIGMVMVVDVRRAPAVLAHFRRAKQPAWIIGKTRRKAPRSGAQKSQVFISRAGADTRVGRASGASDIERAVLDY
jgi:phosphoribosylaminoimidazole synthetase